MNPLALSLAVFLVLPLPVAAQEIGTVSVVEGALGVIRGTSVLQGTEGMRLRQGDIIKSSDRGFVQLEFDEGRIVALGPSSGLFLFSYAIGRGGAEGGNRTSAAEMVLLSGWLKGENGSTVGACRYDSPLLASGGDGTILLHSAAEAAEIFVESGSASIAQVNPDGSWGHRNSAKAGQFFSRLPGKGVTIDSRPNSVFIESMPIPFRDTLPSRRARFVGKRVDAKRDHEVTYAEIQPWLTMGKTWRRGFVERFQPRLKDASFRKALEDHLNDHPEWNPIVHPEKYPPTPPSGPDQKF